VSVELGPHAIETLTKDMCATQKIEVLDCEPVCLVSDPALLMWKPFNIQIKMGKKNTHRDNFNSKNDPKLPPF
jgi:hypothetical protein